VRQFYHQVRIDDVADTDFVWTMLQRPASQECARLTAEILATLKELDVIAGKWKVKIICHLFGGTKRFSELRRLLPGVHRGTLAYEFCH
jgi:hypothetical protein